MLLNKEEFTRLSPARRQDVLWQYGEVIGEKAYYDCNITLFLLGSFYVEVFFNRVENAVVSIAVQDDSQILYAYIQDLGLEELLGGSVN